MAAYVTAFDAVASAYDRLWTESAVGAAQRHAVWKVVDCLFVSGETILDLGCGTGADAVHFREIGIRVYGIDSSPRMAGVARSKGVVACVLKVEDLAQLSGSFDGAISNFGALNCIESLSSTAQELARLVRPGGCIALCFLGRICFWEIAYYLVRGKIGKAFRRVSGSARSSYGLKVFYPSEYAIRKAFEGSFSLLARYGIGIAVPPSYVGGAGHRLLKHLGSFDARVASLPPFRSLADHRLYVWRRV